MKLSYSNLEEIYGWFLLYFALFLCFNFLFVSDFIFFFLKGISHLLGKEGRFKVKVEAFSMFGLEVGFLNSLPWKDRSFVFYLIKAFMLNT